MPDSVMPHYVMPKSVMTGSPSPRERPDERDTDGSPTVFVGWKDISVSEDAELPEREHWGDPH